MESKNIKIIVADDEERLRHLIKDFLVRDGYTVIEAEDGEKAVEQMESNPDTGLIIMDVMMPNLDGWAASKKIRQISNVPIMMLTARSEDFDQLMGFESGADDYVTKPFSPAVLLKRIEALLKRSHQTSAVPSKKSGLYIDSDAYSAYLDGEELELTVKEFEILRLLSSNVGRVFTRSQLLDIIWGYDYEGDSRAVDSHVARLRTKLGNYGTEHIKTVYGIGYKIEA